MSNWMGRSRSWRRRSSTGKLPLCKDEIDCMPSVVPIQQECQRQWHRRLSPVKRLPQLVRANSFISPGRIGTLPAKEKSPQPQKMRQQLPAKSEWQRHNNGQITVAVAASQATAHVPTTVPCTVVEMFDAANTGPLSPRPACCRLQDTPIKQNGTGIGMARQQSGTHRQTRGKDMTLTNNNHALHPPSRPGRAVLDAEKLTVGEGKAPAAEEGGRPSRRRNWGGKEMRVPQRQKFVKFAETIKINEIAPREDGSIASSCSNTSNASSSSALESLMEENGQVWPGKRQSQRAGKQQINCVATDGKMNQRLKTNMAKPKVIRVKRAQQNGAQNDSTHLEELIEQFFHHCQSISTVDGLQQRPLYDNLQPAADGTAHTEDTTAARSGVRAAEGRNMTEKERSKFGRDLATRNAFGRNMGKIGTACEIHGKSSHCTSEPRASTISLAFTGITHSGNIPPIPSLFCFCFVWSQKLLKNADRRQSELSADAVQTWLQILRPRAGPNEKYELEQLRQQRLKLLEDTTFRLNTIKSMTPLQAYNHTVSTLNHYRERLGVPEVLMNQTQWTIWGSIYFSMTVYTTIGYGNIVPVTTSGRILTIIYALIGIPLALIALITLGGLFAKICLVLWQLIARSLGCFSKKLERKMTIEAKLDENGVEMDASRESLASESDEGNDELLQFPVWFLIAVTIIWILLCAYLFLLWEETWDYGLSLYFVLISFLTIGFGDVIPSKPNYIILVGIMILIGLALVSTVLTIIQKQINALADNMKGTIDKDYQTALEELGEEEVEPIDGQPQKEAANGKASRAVDFDRTKGLSPEERKQENRRTLDSVVARMPLRSRILYHIMPSGNRKQLTRHVQRRQRVGNKCVQTDQWLLDTVETVHQNANF
uniref:Potassium channel domain-containing protein n=1 Tax=Globodera rostochiensis TaxID=31243 RepID=A0A914IG20_GLORO